MHSRVSKTHSQCLQKCYIFAGSHFLVQQRVCDNQDFVKTEQLKAYSRVLQTHVHVIGDAKGERSPRRLGQMNKFTTFCLYTTLGCARNVAGSFFFPPWKKKMPSISWTPKRSYPAVKKILQERTVFIKADPFLRKIHFKKVKKDHEEKMLSFFFLKKKRIKTKTFFKK